MPHEDAPADVTLAAAGHRLPPPPPAPVPAQTLANVVANATDRLDEMEDRLTAILTAIIERAGRQAAAEFRRHATNHLTAAALREADRAAMQRLTIADLGGGFFGYRLRPEMLTAAAPSPNSAMLCVKPRPDEAQAIADPDGEPPDDLHVTLVYLGEISTEDIDEIREAVLPVAQTHGPLSGVVGGYGRFEPAGVGILLPDVPGLVELRVAVTEALVEADLAYARNHGFEAHITIDSSPEPGEADEMLPLSGSPLHFDALLLVRGDDIVAELPLVGRPPLTAAGESKDTSALQRRVDDAQDALRRALGTGNEEAIREAKAEVKSAQAALYKAVKKPTWSKPGADEVLDTKALMKALRTKTNPVRQALIQNILGSGRKLVDPIDTNFRWERVPPSEVGDSLVEDVLGWPGEAEDVAGAAISEAQSGTGDLYLLRDRTTGELVAVANVEAGGDSLIVHNIASIGGGAGTTLLQTISRNAAIDKLGVRLRATPQAADYYRSLPGFKEGNNLDFHLPAADASAFAAGAAATSSRVGQMFDVTNPLVSKALADTGEHITSIADTTRADVMKVITASWQEGLSIPDTAKAIQAAMTEAAPVRARMIARTELVGAINGGSLAATQLVSGATGTPYMKQWMTAPGARNPRHELYVGLDGQTVALDETFDVGGAPLQHPGDPDGPPEEVINCRCSMSYVEAQPSAADVRQSIDQPTMWGEENDPRLANL